MKLIIGIMDDRMKNFIKVNNFDSKIIVINKMCNIKTIKDEVDVIIPFGFVNEYGIISNTSVHIYELIMTLKVNKILYGNISNKIILDKISNDYSIPVDYISLKNETKRQIL